jgi:hypothetical protein
VSLALMFPVPVLIESDRTCWPAGVLNVTALDDFTPQ